MKVLTSVFAPLSKTIGFAAILALLGATSAVADVVYVTSMIQGCTATSICGGVQTDGTYTEVTFTLGVTGIKGTATGRPITPTASRAYLGSALVTDTNAGVDITPTLGIAGGVYQIDYNWSANAGNSSTDVVISVTADNATLSFTNTELFRRSNGVATAWKFMGYITNNPGVTQPVLHFRYASGKVTASDGNRLLFDCWRFTAAQPCLLVAVPTVTGPLGSNSTEVVVTGVSSNASQVNIYQDAGSGMTNIGTLPVSNPGATVNVPVTGVLKKGAQVSATQVIAGQESCVQNAGAFVGGGANPNLRMVFSFRYDPNNTGPVGAPGTTGGNVYFLGVSNVLSGSAPGDAAPLVPSTNWQTVTFLRGDEANPTDPSVIWNGTGPGVLSGTFGALDGMAIACEGDPGPIDVYFDHLENGTNGVVQDWEAATPGAAAYQFSQPSFSGTTSGNILTAPNSSIVATNTAFSGAQCCRVRFQFSDGLLNRWVRLVTANNVGAVINPTLDLNEPVSIKVLLLPPGATPPPPPVNNAPGPLSIAQAGADLILNWTGSFPLQSSTNITGPFTDVGVTNAPYTNASTATTLFFRLRGN